MSVEESGLPGGREGDGPGLVGRPSERAALSAALTGAGAAVLLRGDPGIGKTSLLEWAVPSVERIRAEIDRLMGF